MSPSDYEMVEQGYDPPRVSDSLEAAAHGYAAIEERKRNVTSDAALEAAMLEWYGPDWRHRFFPGRSDIEIPRVLDAMHRAIEAANAVTRAALKDKP